MWSLVPGRDFRGSLNSGSHEKVCRCFYDSQWQFFFFFGGGGWRRVVRKKMFELSPFRWWRINTSLNNLSTLMAWPTVAKNQGNQFSQYLDVTNGHLVSSSAYFPWNMTLKYKMKLSQGSWDKILHSKLRTLFLEGSNFFFSGGLSLEAIDQSSGSSFHNFFVKTTKES